MDRGKGSRYPTPIFTRASLCVSRFSSLLRYLTVASIFCNTYVALTLPSSKLVKIQADPTAASSKTRGPYHLVVRYVSHCSSFHSVTSASAAPGAILPRTSTSLSAVQGLCVYRRQFRGVRPTGMCLSPTRGYTNCSQRSWDAIQRSPMIMAF